MKLSDLTCPFAVSGPFLATGALCQGRSPAQAPGSAAARPHLLPDTPASTQNDAGTLATVGVISAAHAAAMIIAPRPVTVSGLVCALAGAGLASAAGAGACAAASALASALASCAA